MAAERDLYQVLGVPPSANPEEIRRAHRTLVRVLHPDRHLEATPAELQLAERRMREVNEAWHALSDASRRRSYDATRVSPPGGASPKARPAGTAAARPGGASSPPRRPGHSTAGRGAYWEPASARQADSSPPGPEEGEDLRVHPGTFFLLRRGPLIAIVAVVLGLFVATAYISGGGDSGGGSAQPLPMDACVALIDQSTGFLVDCELPNSGEVVAQVKAPLDCPDESRYVKVGSEFFCIPISGGG